MRKHFVILLAVLLALLSASVVTATDRTILSGGTETTGQDTGVSTTSTALPSENSDRFAELAAETAELRAKITALESERRAYAVAANVADQHGKPRKARAYRAHADSLSAEIKKMKAQPFGGYNNQKKAYTNLSGVGYITRGQADLRYDRKNQTTKILEEPKMNLVAILILGVIAAAIITIGIIIAANLARRNGNGMRRNFFLRDVDHEPAKAMNGIDTVGRREIVAESADGDYSRETAVSEAVAIVEAQSTAEALAYALELQNARRERVLATVGGRSGASASVVVPPAPPANKEPEVPVKPAEKTADEKRLETAEARLKKLEDQLAAGGGKGKKAA